MSDDRPESTAARCWWRRRRRSTTASGAALTFLAAASSVSLSGSFHPVCRRAVGPSAVGGGRGRIRPSASASASALSAAAETEGEQSERAAGDGSAPLFDAESAGDLSDESLFRVSDVSRRQPRSQRQEQEPTLGEELGLFEDIVEDEWYGDERDSELGSDSTGNLAGAAAVASDASSWTAYARDEDDLLTEREDRLYIDEKGLARRVERCVLVGVEDLGFKRRKAKQERKGVAGDLGGGRGRVVNPEEDQVYFSLEESMTEMRELIKTSGLDLVGEVTQRLNEPNPKTYIGTGKVKEAQDLMKELDACTIVFDAELSPGQQKSLENTFNKKVLQNDFMGAEQEGEIKVIDRTALILDIFAQHAKTREGKLQVDLALHEYRKPRLTRMWTHLERQSGAGGVGLRGPGESQLEIDKRLLRDRIIVLKQKIDDVQKQRDLHRRGRSNSGLPVLALVGYTNAGKSTLLNYLTRAGVMAENILFATLDPTTRRVKLPGYKTHPEVLLTDTVGFIQKLPTHLVAAFRATLEEVREADVLVHVVDVSNPVWRKQETAVMRVLNEIGAGDKPVVRVLNKIDLLDRDDAEFAKTEMAESHNAVAVSSLTGDGMQDFVAVTEEALSGLLVPVELLLPYSRGEEVNTIHEVGAVDEVDYREAGTYVRGRVPRAVANRLAEYSVRPDPQLEEHPMAEKMKKIRGDAEDEMDWASIGRGRHKAKHS